MFDPIPIMLAREGVRAGMERPQREPADRRRARCRAAVILRRLADWLEPVCPEPVRPGSPTTS